MRECDIEAARTIRSEMFKLAEATAHMYSNNINNFNSDCTNVSRAARNIVRMYNIIDDAYNELDSLHECYLAQFTDFDDDGEMIDTLPDFDFSEQSRLERKAFELWNDARNTLTRAIVRFAIFKGIHADYFALLNDDNLRNFIRDFVRPEFRRQSHYTATILTNNSAAPSVFVAKNTARKNVNRRGVLVTSGKNHALTV